MKILMKKKMLTRSRSHSSLKWPTKGWAVQSAQFSKLPYSAESKSSTSIDPSTASTTVTARMGQDSRKFWNIAGAVYRFLARRRPMGPNILKNDHRRTPLNALEKVNTSLIASVPIPVSGQAMKSAMVWEMSLLLKSHFDKSANNQRRIHEGDVSMIQTIHITKTSTNRRNESKKNYHSSLNEEVTL